MVSSNIRTEADNILRSGLQTILGRHGDVHIVGSYALGLMTWRDLDIHVVREHLDVAAFFDLGGEIARLLKPHRMHFRDESSVGTPGLPCGYYWGVYLGDERAGAWKIDIWQTNRDAFNLVRRFEDDLSARLNDTNRAVILEIKADCWRHPQYRRGFTSADVYAAVLDRGVRDVPGFWTDLRETKGIMGIARAKEDQNLHRLPTEHKEHTNMTPKNTICLWFDKDAHDAARFYAATFPDSEVTAVHKAPGDYPGGKKGDALTVEFTVVGIPCLGLNGGPAFRHSEAFSFQIATDTQEETDRYWNAIVGNGGKESQCGWCRDRWGLSWQITPRTLSEALAAGGDEAKRAFEAMMSMTKIDIATIEAARRG
jgi:predicted 3-demethylubiquinone-9 3-methyltransferase (glyoxalase superfamily)